MTEGSGPILHGVRSDAARSAPLHRVAPDPFPTDSPPPDILDAPTERRLLWTATVLGAASMALTVGAGLGRTKLVAVALGPAALGLLGQQASLTVLLSYLTTFGTAGGTTRLLRDALLAGDEAQATRVLWTSSLLKAATCTVIGGAVLLGAAPIAHLAFGTAAHAGWVRWVALSLPLTALSAVAMATLRAERRATRHSVAQGVAAVASVLVVALLVWPGDPHVVQAIPAIVALALAVAMTAAAWPRLTVRWRSGARAFDRGLARQIASYGTAQVVISATSALGTMLVGRTLLTHVDAVTAGHFYALALGGDALLALLLGGYHTHYFPSLCSASTARDASALLGRIVRTLALFALPLLATGILAAPVAVRVLLSPDFVSIVPLVGLVLVGVYLRTVTAVLAIPFLAGERLMAAVLLHASWTVALVTTFFWLGPDAGPSSWAYAFVATTAAHVAVLLVSLWRLLDIRVGTGTIALVAGSAAALLALALS